MDFYFIRVSDTALLALMILLFLIFSFKGNAVESQLQNMQLTCYNDGESCPGNCDAHAVFKDEHNSSSTVLRNAYAPGTRGQPKPCVLDENCTICFSKNPDDCVTTKYRGSGPPQGRFDITPEFLKKFCFTGSGAIRKDIPQEIISECKRVQNISDLYQTKINCIRDFQNPLCRNMMSQKQKEYDLDRKEYLDCLRIGQDNYNKTHARNMQRKFSCTYNMFSDSRGYSRLLAGACKPGTFVSPGGFDCCAADTIQSACSGDCGVYYKDP